MRSLQPISAGSMADIAFLLLIFFMVTTTMKSEIGLNRKLPPDEESTGEIRQRNVLNVLINDQDELLVNGESMTIKQLESHAAKFIANADDDPNMPEKTMQHVSLLGDVLVSKQVISLQCAAHTSYGTYVGIQDALAAAYRAVRNDLSQRSFNIMFDELLENKDVDRVAAIQAIYPMRISEAEPFQNQ